MALSGAALHFLDLVPDGFLMDLSNPEAVRGPARAVVADVYGIPVDAAAFEAFRDSRLTTCIWDLAMTIPRPDDLSRLQPTDVALVSFGIGKCLYAGWGGVLLSNNPDLVGRVRSLRDAGATKETLAVRLRHGLSVLARTAAHGRRLYAYGRAVANWRNARMQAARRCAVSTPASKAPTKRGFRGNGRS